MAKRKKPEGSGRKKGSLNKNTLKFAAFLEELDYDPLKELVENLNGVTLTKRLKGIKDPLVRLAIYKDSLTLGQKAVLDYKLLKYKYPNLRSVEIINDDKNKKSIAELVDETEEEE